ncbi:MAG: hypothetical protein HYS26_04540 [Candidatus Kaiserbacteria bacterium]|nr:MAG: hypothetical protein HYS26_04540 [Candidatus Kaiserbacteria bacterium]
MLPLPTFKSLNSKYIPAIGGYLWHHRIATALLISLAIFATQFVLLQLPEAKAAYSISNSARFNDDDSARLSRTPSSAGNKKTWTWSAWVKRANLTDGILFSAEPTAGDHHTSISFNSDKLQFQRRESSSNAPTTQSTAVFRDPSQWMHVVVAVDTTAATAGDRVIFYVNGQRIARDANDPSQNVDTRVNGTDPHAIGRFGNSNSTYFDGYLSDVYLIDGQALTPSSFGETDANGYWRPKSYTGTYGTNGFKLDFASGSDLGNDVSGQNNDWTANNINATDQEVDTPTNMYPTLNVLNKPSISTYSQGNLYSSRTGTNATDFATMGITSGKWYFEARSANLSGICNVEVGVANTNASKDEYVGQTTNSWGWLPANSGSCTGGKSCTIYNTTLTAYGPTYSTCSLDLTLGVAIDADAGKLFVRDESGWFESSDPVAGTNAAFSNISTTTPIFPVVGMDAGVSRSTESYLIFGQSKNPTSTATTLTYDSAAGGYFMYTPPTGFKAISTANLPEPAVTVPKNYFDAVAYTGSGAAQSVSRAAASTAGQTVTVYLTDTTAKTWQVPSDWGNASNTIEVIGGGGGGVRDGTADGDHGGGGGGAYSKVSNLSLTPGGNVTFQVGAGGAGGATNGSNGSAGTDTFFNRTSGSANTCADTVSVCAKAGNGAVYLTGSGAGGLASASVGSTKYNGGTGGYISNNYAGQGGGGAGGPSGAGADGVSTAGLGAGVAGTSGGQGGNGLGGAGGTGVAGAAGGNGGNGTEWDATHGSGGGGAGGSGQEPTGSAGGNGGSYGGGGGSGGYGGTTTGNGGAGAQGIIKITYVSTGVSFGFTPSLVWIKDRTSANAHGLFDAIRSVFPYLSSNATTAETGGASTTLTSFLSNGFTLGTNALFNTSGNNYVSWNWKEDTTSRFDIVNYTGTGANRTVSHSLGVAPDFMIIKDRGATNDWAVYHTANTSDPKTDYLLLNSTAATADDATYWNDTAPTASVFSLGTNADVNTSGNNYVAYLFASTTGYSSFGSYTGNGSSDGPFVYTGFKPAFLLVKRSDSASTNGWYIWDNRRSAAGDGNLRDIMIYANLTNADDGSSRQMDFLSNGFKPRATDANYNASGATYVYAAFAEQPFQQSAQAYNLTIASSTRFNDDDSASLTKTFSSAGTGAGKTATFSFWVKRANLGTEQFLINWSAYSADGLRFTTSDTLYGYAGNETWSYTTNAKFRDPGAWLHIVFTVDSTQATAADRIRLWVNGVAQTWSGSGYTSMTQNSDVNVLDNVIHAFGKQHSGTSYYDGYLADFYAIDGQALTPSDFGEYDASGYWRPKTYSGTYGTNGFHLPLTSTSPGDDTSSNNNDWTANNLDATDNVKDSPTNGSATLNILANSSSDLTAAQGNLTATIDSFPASPACYTFGRSSIGPTSGKWYAEIVPTGTTGVSGGYLIGASSVQNCILESNYLAYTYAGGGNKRNSSSDSAYGDTFTTNDVIGVALDLDNGKIWFSKNGTWQASGDPAAGTNSAFTGLTGPLFIGAGAGQTSGQTHSYNFNFGQSSSPTSTATVLPYRSSAGGYFQYAPPTDFKALSTTNLPTPTITQPDDYFDALTYTGTGAALSVTGLDFTPTLTWIKDRTSANAHGLFDSLRSTFPYLSSNATTIETSSASALTAFLENGFTLGTNSLFNTSGNNYISWLWKEDPTSGFDIVPYAGTGANRTISHSLSSAPEFMIVKDRGATNDWAVYHAANTSAPETDYLLMNGTAATADDATYWNDTAPTASVFSLGTNADVNTSGNNYVAYLFDEISGFSDFGSYTGNGSADGPFVYTGFKPKYVVIKRTDTLGYSWNTYDAARDTSNPISPCFGLESNAAETASCNDMDFLANGFKQRNTAAGANASGGTYVYMAFAEQPFKYSAASAASVVSSFVQAIAFLIGMSFFILPVPRGKPPTGRLNLPVDAPPRSRWKAKPSSERRDPPTL